jgi:uncharacterized protein YkwD
MLHFFVSADLSIFVSMQRFILILFCLISIRSNSQVLIIGADLDRAASLMADRIIYDDKLGWVIDCEKLDELIRMELNRFRKSNGLNKLKDSERCDSVARDQTRYMVKTGKFSHERDSLNFTQRIRLVIGSGHFGENLLLETTPGPINIYKENYDDLRSKYPDFNFMWEADRATYTALVRRIIKKWIDSPSHYKNLINPLWHYFSVSSISTGKDIYVTLVFEE